mmetsp:Transcript_21059/g.40077  ORF Transcript_21059/g.40077 Transcript_21059/m.40077 type:complete len:491 (+) Transcript_21059:146-1618(+)
MDMQLDGHEMANFQHGQQMRLRSATETTPLSNDPIRSSKSTHTIPDHYWSRTWRLLKDIWPLLLGGVVEFYESTSFGLLEDELEKKLFDTTAWTWAAYALAFVVRPIGGLLFGRLGDVVGRHKSTMLAILGITAGTVLEGLIPAHLVDWHHPTSLSFVVLCRVLIGLCAGGEAAGLAVTLSEAKDQDILGAVTAFIAISASIGYLLASGVVGLLQWRLSENDVEDGYWRVAFVLGIVPGSVCLFLTSKFSPEAQDDLPAELTVEAYQDPHGAAERHDHTSTWSVLNTYKMRVLTASLATMGSAGVLYVSSVYAVSFVEENGLAGGFPSWCSFFCQLLSGILALPVGVMADTWGVGKVHVVANVVAAVTVMIGWGWLIQYPTSKLVNFLAIGVIFGVANAMVGTVYTLFIAEMFPQNVRFTGVGMSMNLAIATAGGCGPIIANLLDDTVGNMAPGYYMAFLCLTSSAVSLYCYIGEKNGTMVASHIRKHPY